MVTCSPSLRPVVSGVVMVMAPAQLPPLVYAALPCEGLAFLGLYSAKELAVMLPTIQVPLAAVLPLTPVIVTWSFVRRPAVLVVLMTMGEALLAPVMVPCKLLAPVILLEIGRLGSSGPALQTPVPM